MPIDGTFGLYVYSAARFAVPFFFVLSGYTLFPHLDTPAFTQKIKKRLTRNAIVTAVAAAVYILADAIWARINGAGFFSTLNGYLNLNKIVKFLLFNDFSLSYSGSQAVHLWFMFALLYSYAALLILNKLLTQKNIKYFAAGGAALMIAFGAFGVAFTVNPQYLYYPDYSLSYIFLQESWLTRALPYIAIGMFLGGFLNKKKFVLENKKPLIIALVFVCVTAYFGIAMLTSYIFSCAYKSTLPIAVGIGLLFLYSKRDGVKESNPMAKLGKYLSLDVYIWHMLLVKIFSVLTQNAHAFTDTRYFTYLRPLIIMAASIIFALCLYFIKKSIKNISKSKRQ